MMGSGRWKTAGEMLGWLLVPLVPVALANGYNEIVLILHNGDLPPDPRDWEWGIWVLQLGPLLGFGFLAGATLRVPDPVFVRRGPLTWVRKRAFWVTVGPWLGFAIVASLYLIAVAAAPLFQQPPSPANSGMLSTTSSEGTWLHYAGAAGFVVFFGYLWLIPAIAAIRRARRIGEARESFWRGLIFATAFTGTLFGAFWAATEAWRNFFFDKRIYPVVLIAASLALLSGCGTPTYGEVRRRELFHVMLLSWTFALALLWRWCARRRPGD